MNRQIKELAADAGYPDYMTYGQDKVLERFSELVQRDTIKNCRDMFITGSVSWNLLNEKLEHFGVE